MKFSRLRSALAVLTPLFATVLWAVLYPHTLRHIGHTSFFSLTSDFIQPLWQQPGGSLRLATAFLELFFEQPWAGAAILTLLTSLPAFAVWALLRRTRLASVAEVAALALCAYLIIFVAPDVFPLLTVTLAAGVAGGFTEAVYRLRPQLFHPSTRTLPAWAVLLTTLAAWGWMGFALTHHETRRAEEKYFTLEQLAEQGRWEELRATARPWTNELPAAVPYALLAESALGTLPQALFSYPVTSPEQFVYRRQYSEQAFHFNALFHLCLGYPDETLHQSFEACTLSRHGITLRGLRLHVESALQAGDAALAAKYIEVMEHVPGMGAEATAFRRRLHTLAHSPQPRPRPLRSKHFIGSVPLDHEWVYMLETDTTNRCLFDYLACTFLLQKQPEKAARLIELSSLYDHRPLPTPYAEAMALFAHDRPQWQRRFQLPAATVERWHEVQRLQQQGQPHEVARRTTGTYWHHLLFGPNPKPLH